MKKLLLLTVLVLTVILSCGKKNTPHQTIITNDCDTVCATTTITSNEANGEPVQDIPSAGTTETFYTFIT